MDSASTFLSASILTGLGFIVIGIVLLVLNNLFHKYWKPVQFSIIPESLRNMPPTRFAEPHEIDKIPPKM